MAVFLNFSFQFLSSVRFQLSAFVFRPLSAFRFCLSSAFNFQLSTFLPSAFNFQLFFRPLSAFNFQLLSSRLSNVWKQREASDLIPCGASSRRGGLPFLIPVFTRNPTSRLQFAIRLALSGFSALLRFTHEQVSTLPSFSGSSTPLGQGRGRISPHERQGKGANTRIRWLVHHRLEAP